MKKIIILIVLVIAITGLSGCTTLYGEPQPPANGARISLSKIEDIATTLNITNITSLINISEDLEIEVYGINDISAEAVLSDYEQKYSEWWLLRYSRNETADFPVISNYNVYTRAWSRTTYVHAIVICDGSLVKQFSDYDTVVITSHGMYTIYEQYFDW